MGGLKCNRLLKMLIVACTYNTPRGPSAARRWNLKTMTMQNNVCHGRPSKKQHVHKKQVNKHNMYTTSKCKQRAVSVCPTSEQWASELRTCTQLFFLCCQWASPGWGCPKGLYWEAWIQSDIWTTQEGGILPTLRFFIYFFFFTASLSISVYPSLSLLVTPTLSHFPLLYFLYPSTEGSTSRSR